jgi:predicted ATPase
MKIKKIIISGIWKKYDIEWELGPNVCILSGNNGIGKTTILDIVAQLIITGQINKEYNTKFNQVDVLFDDGTKLSGVNFNDSYKKLKSKAESNEMYKSLIDDVDIDLGGKAETAKGLMITASIVFAKNKGKNINIESFIERINSSIISSFDTTLPSEDDQNRHIELKKEGVQTDLDLELYYMQEKYSYYLADLARRVEDRIVNNEIVDNEFVYNLYKEKNTFIKIINEFFAETGKKIDGTQSKLSFILEDGQRISLYKLSSGEKQLIYIFLKVLLHNQKECIIFMDEPEISLHVDWQKILLSKILELNPNTQMIIATHSPSLIMNGWAEHIINVQDIRKPCQPS